MFLCRREQKNVYRIPIPLVDQIKTDSYTIYIDFNYFGQKKSHFPTAKNVLINDNK